MLQLLATVSFCCCCVSCCGFPLQNGLRLRRFKSDRDEIWHSCFASKYSSIDGIGFCCDVILSYSERQTAGGGLAGGPDYPHGGGGRQRSS